MDQNLTLGQSFSELTSTDYRSIFDNGPALYLILKPDPAGFIIADVSKSFLQTLGNTRDEVLGRLFFEVFPDNPADPGSRRRRSIRSSLKSVQLQKRPVEVPLVRYDIYNRVAGQYEVRYWNIKNTPIFNVEGVLDYIIFSVNDVTEVFNLAERERQAHEAVELQRKQLYNLFMQTPVAIGIFIGPQHIVELANPTLCTIFGRSEDELFGQPIFQVMPESAGRGIETFLGNVLETGRHHFGLEQAVPIVRDGIEQTFYFNFVYEPLYEIDGTISGVILVAIDVTNQIQNRQKLEENEHRLKLALELSNLGLWDVDVKNNVATRDKRYAGIFGYSSAATPWTTRIFLDHVVPEDQEHAIESIEKAYSKTGKLNMKLRIRWMDGSIHWIHSMGTVLYDENQDPIRMIGTVQDVTDRQEQDRHKDEFISAVSHELKTPLTSLKAFCQLLHRKFIGQSDPKAADMLAKMNTQINRLNVIVHDLLDVTRIEGDKIQYRQGVFQFEELLRDIVEEVQRTSGTHTIIMESPDTQVTVYADRERLGQVITNLLTNAIKYSPGKDQVRVDLQATENKLICSVKDLGIGIPKEKQKVIFDRFFRVHENDLGGGAGLGLGLYICHEIIKRQNGHIWVESQVGEGSTFYFSLPL
jgi:two-component system, OmpR family, sensor histidine kinase VicK